METTPPPETPEAEKVLKIKTLNDVFRTSLFFENFFCTQGIQALGETAKMEILMSVQKYNDFTQDNDPYGEHDFGSFEYEGQKIFWKIDYYDKSMTFGSEDPSDADQTTRVMTIMLAEEY